MAEQAQLARLASVPAFFAVRIASAVVLLKVATSALPVSAYGEFTQLVQFNALLNLVAVGGTQNGLIRQAAAADDDDSLSAIHGAALIIWGATALLLLAMFALASGSVSTVLVGRPDERVIVLTIALLSLLSGPGQIWCSILSGRKRIQSSLAAQAVGLVGSTAGAAEFIVHGHTEAAAIAFASGSLLTLAVAAIPIARLRLSLPKWASSISQVRPLIGYSAAFAATSSYSALVLFGLRSLYRQHFGPTALGYWIAANRVSDLSTQLLGLFMIQVFVSHLAAIKGEAEQRAFILRCWLVASAGMFAILACFWAASAWLVPLFLSRSFVPATPVIRTYMIGDALRVSASLAMFTAFSRGRPARYAAIEMATLSLMAVIAVALILAGDPRAPQIAYVSAYAVTAVLVIAAFILPARGAARVPLRGYWRPRGEHRTLRRDSDAPPRGLPLSPQDPSPAVPPAL
jgi:O-antigen/teichoic acid export membrane protein